MTTLRTIALLFSLCMLLPTAALAQKDDSAKPPAQSPAAAPSVTVSVTAKGVRFAAPGGIGQLRLEVFDATGSSLYNSEFRSATVFDWPLQDKEGRALPDGEYLCVITIRNASGRLGVKQGTVVVENGQAALRLDEAQQVAAVEAEQSLTAVTDSASVPATLTAHDGEVGQVVSTAGPLSFRLGDFFSGLDRERMRLTPEGRLGIGTSNPKATLDVEGTIRTSEGIEFADGTRLTSASQLSLLSKGDGTKPAGKGEIFLPAAAGTGTQNRLSKWAESGGAGTLTDSNVTETGGQVGIGTTSPASLLHLAGPSGVSAITLNTPGNQRFRFQTVPGVQNWGALTLNANFNGGWILDDTTTNGWFFKLDTRGGNASGPNNGLWLFKVPSGANPHTDEFPIFGVSSGHAFFDGNVGIGTQTPGAKLEVAGNIKLTGTGAGLIFPDGTKLTTVPTGGGGGGGVSGTGTANKVALWTNGTTLSNSSITQGASGAIEVAGNFNATGTITGGNVVAKYQDVAEWVPARGHVPAGTVVSLDRSRNNTVMPATRAYDTHVAGVVSARPGLILGEGGEGQVMVATTGRVKVRVDAGRGAIRVGDLLVTSGMEGVAMRSRPVRVGGVQMHRPGTIVGKALEPLKRGRGEILVLLSLQ